MPSSFLRNLKEWLVFCFGISVNMMLEQIANYLFFFVHVPFRTELSGFDDWPPIQSRVSKSDNE